ncbi:MAG: InlB B-repeat-containing protein [Tyzzerella sp.]|nr:InlB B-repeat-containing protein [Tyzzerella sp.]
MRKKAFTKRILAVALSIIMVLGLMPVTAFAYPGDGGAILTSNDPGQYDMDGRPLLVYVTPNGGYVGRTSGGNSDSTQQFTATAYDGWFFSQWRTYYEGPSSDESNPNHTWDSEWCFSEPGDSESKPNLNSAMIQVNREWDDKGTYYLYAIFNPIITIRIDEGVEGYLYFKVIKNGTGDYSKNLGGSGEASRQLSHVEYGYGLQFEVKLKDTHLPVRVSVNGVDKTSEYLNADFERDNGGTILFPTNATTPESDADMLWLTGPVAIEVTTRLINSIVQFDANGGSGAMAAQTYSYGEAQALTENRFGKTGYTFAGWNTKADGTGTAYTDKQSVTFTPVNDGESITLYAQWTECTNHSWENGKCSNCGISCSHSGGTATCTEKATCTECGMKYGTLKDHSYTYSANEAVITETCTNGCDHSESTTINAPVGTLVYDGTEKKATVSYSDGWQGGELSVAYESDNINAGDVTAKITISGVTATVDYKIDKMEPAYTVPTGLTVTYGDTLANVELPEGWSWKDSTASAGDVGTNTFKAVFTPVDTDNYKTIEADVSVKVEPKEIGIRWGTTEFIYSEGKAQAPTATATGIITGDQIALIISGAKVDAGSYTATVTGITGDKAANYKLPSNVTTAFTIGNAFQTAPVVTSENETIFAKGDGKIMGVDSTMEYRKEDGSNYTVISSSEIIGLEAGKYYVRYAAKSNYDASEDTKITITAGRKLTVTVPQNQRGYILTVDKTEFEYMGGFEITFKIAEGYSKTENFAIKLNGEDMQWGNFDEIGVQSCSTDIEITVEGVGLIIHTSIPAKDSPETGDAINLWRWFALLFVSGAGIFGITYSDCKRRAKTTTEKE